jgi:hypothetical protein
MRKRRMKPADISGIKREYLKDKIDKLQRTVRTRTSETYVDK